MIAAWMLYATALGALLGGGAVALGGLALVLRRATRWLWLCAIAGTLAVPALLALRPRPATAVPSAPAAAGAAPAVSQVRSASDGRRVSVWHRVDLARLNRALLVGWAAASATLAIVLLGASLAQRRAGRGWAAQVLDGTPVLVAPDAGPLVSGLWRLEIVLPQWALLRSEEERRMMLAHEEEHRRARDPNLLLLGVLALVLNPWNLALWWQLRRLRLAIETDCDRRVLGAGVDVRGYGSLLLEVGSRSVRQPVFAGAAFSETQSLLERRIDAMTAPAPRHPVARAFALATVAAGVLVLACAAPRPEPIRPTSAPERLFPPLAIPRPPSAPASPYTHEQMAGAIARYFPDVLRGDTAHLPIRFVLDADGHVVSTSRGPITTPLFTPGRLEYAQIENVGPGYYGPARVRLEVFWLKPDSVASEAPSAGFTTVTTESPSDTVSSRPSFEEEARTWLSARPELLRGLGANDTAYVWFVLDGVRHVVRAGRAGSIAAMQLEAHVEQPGGWGQRDRFRPGVLADGMVVVAAWWPSL